MMAWLDGKKTYITVIIGFIFNIGCLVGWWTVDNQVVIQIDGLLGFLGLNFLRAGVTKSGPTV